MRCLVCDEKVRWYQSHCYRTENADGTGKKIAAIHQDCLNSTVAEWIYQELRGELEALRESQ